MRTLCGTIIAAALSVRCFGALAAEYDVAASPVPDGMDECAKLFKDEIADGVIHGAAVVAGGLDGNQFSGSWGCADAAHTIPMTTRTVIDMAEQKGSDLIATVNYHSK